MIILYILISLFASWIWIDYFRKIDIFEREELKYMIAVFLIGSATTFLVFPVNTFLIEPLGFGLNGDYLNDFVYSVLGIGLVEETVKGLPVLLFLFFYRKHFNEPLDYLLYAAMSALGFSFIENVTYALRYEADVFYGRTVMSSVSHMIDAAFWIYGFILVRFRGGHWYKIPMYMLMAALSHGFYDFWTLAGITGGFLATIVFYMITVSVFAIILNNCLNASAYFTYKKAVDTALVQNALLRNYALMLAGIGLVSIIEQKDFIQGIRMLTVFLIIFGGQLLIIIIRISRFKLIHNRWNPVRIELPFEYHGTHLVNYPGMSRQAITVKGSAYNEELMAPFYQELCIVGPWIPDHSELGGIKAGFIFEKLFLMDDDVFHHVHVFVNDHSGTMQKYLLHPRKSGTTSTNEDYPICALLEHRDPAKELDDSYTSRDFRFVEWVYLRPLKPEEREQFRHGHLLPGSSSSE